MEDLFDTYDTPEEEVWGSDDYDQLKRDYKYHPRTSTESLRWLARFTAVYDSPYLSDHLEEASKWWADGLNYKADREQLQFAINQTTMPAEVENSDGTINGSITYYESTLPYFEELTDENLDDFDASGDWSKYEEHGIYHMERTGANASLESVTNELINSTKDAALREWRTAHPPSQQTRQAALELRGNRFKQHMERQAQRLRWRGMEEYDAVAKADDKLREGLKRRRDTSGAKPLPNIDNLRVTFDVRDGVLVRRASGKPTPSTKVKILGENYATARIAYAVTHGVDPADKMVRNGVATNYRKASGHVRRDDVGKWEAMVHIDKETITVGTYRSDRQAKEACRLYLASLDMGIL